MFSPVSTETVNFIIALYLTSFTRNNTEHQLPRSLPGILFMDIAMVKKDAASKAIIFLALSMHLVLLIT